MQSRKNEKKKLETEKQARKEKRKSESDMQSRKKNEEKQEKETQEKKGNINPRRNENVEKKKETKRDTHKKVTFKNVNEKTRTKNHKKKEAKHDREIKIMYANANGITGKKPSLSSAIRTHNSDIIAIVETKLIEHPPKLEGYTWITKNRKGRKGGGIAFAYKDELDNVISEKEEQDDIELLWVEIKTGKNKTFIGTYYGQQEGTPNQTQEEMDKMRCQIHRLQQEGEIIILGDFNAKIQIKKGNEKQETSRNGRILEDLLTNTNMSPVSVTKGLGMWTRVNRNKTAERSVIDYVIMTEKIAEETHSIQIDEEGTLRLKSTGKRGKETDHNTITLTTKMTIPKVTEKKTLLKKGNAESWSKYNAIIQEELGDKETITYNDFQQTVKKALKEGIGMKTITIGGTRNQENETIKKLREEKKKHKKNHWNAIKTKHNEQAARKEYIKSQKTLREAIEKHEQETTKEKLEKLVKEGGIKSQSFWNIRKKIMPRKTQDKHNTVTEEGKTIINKEEAKEHIAKYYEDLYQAREAEEDYKEITRVIQTEVEKMNQKTQHNNRGEISEQEIKTAIKATKRNKANGPDNIPNEAMIEANTETREIMRKTLNNIMDTVKIPEEWQKGVITRLYKGKGTKGKCSNERGITVTSNVGKVFERIINNRAREDKNDGGASWRE